MESIVAVVVVVVVVFAVAVAVVVVVVVVVVAVVGMVVEGCPRTLSAHHTSRFSYVPYPAQTRCSTIQLC